MDVAVELVETDESAFGPGIDVLGAARAARAHLVAKFQRQIRMPAGPEKNAVEHFVRRLGIVAEGFAQQGQIVPL